MHIGNKIVKFPPNNDGIYLIKPNKLWGGVAEEKKININEGFINFQIAGGNKECFSKCQYNRSLVAIKLYHTLGAPNLRYFDTVVRHNSIQNFPVTA